MILQTETIAAISTPRGKGGIAVIRLSGKTAVSVAEAMFRAPAPFPDRKAVFGEILDEGDTVCDSGICTVYYGPRSYTGEDVCEISCHGGIQITKTVLSSALAHGARLALPGEFTKRAFLNGKLSLTEAEAVGRLIDADTDGRMRLASGAARGTVSREINRIADSLISVMTALYAAIDYPDEDIPDEDIPDEDIPDEDIPDEDIPDEDIPDEDIPDEDIPDEDIPDMNIPEESVAAGNGRTVGDTAAGNGAEGEKRAGGGSLSAVVRKARRDVERLLSTYKTGKAVSDGVRCVLCGRPNVGKSSLFNRITGEEAAIVTSVAGTTRDVLRETVSFGGVTLRLSDTAGLRGAEETSDAVERIGVSRAEEEMEGAELALVVLPAVVLQKKQPFLLISHSDNQDETELSNKEDKFLSDENYKTNDFCRVNVPDEDFPFPLWILPKCTRIAVLNKADLLPKTKATPSLPAEIAQTLAQTFDFVVLLSCAVEDDALDCGAYAQALTEAGCAAETGIAGLARAVASLYGSDKIDLSRDAVIWDVRQEEQLRRAAAWLEEAEEALRIGDAVDAVCTTVEAAAAALSETDGRGITEEIVNGIFSRFCVGK